VAQAVRRSEGFAATADQLEKRTVLSAKATFYGVKST
jgi:hypothetical protein